ncbi:ABC transporter ATP-binding protein [Neomoorella thermoacetica]|uniref:ABC transporter related protein n=1 Tax=Moorella thermoacetica (strain ATCC 39073 / JCM 9320) TaxID=264732 RepID=Q2RJB1_MOOTA|nr:ABC transporter ATP-binding protein [Moorella thermoacetica]AKX93931.1 ABC transporter ATP-binding protein YtrB [Moorella thermoacetica]AKX96572.1 ABC transporter ATP-binding protein YtrB [Moorella thermoacetica]OIQ56301.1 ABC transporter ATP-binding protein YtrB [Moorella thermoacetica]OIQ57742.1 ABC transporter ATP-binding protein YtrB [Moorella thermoacetica]QDA00386.1 ABC transporter ATP-binding protein YtrB [Moorella thermoacetica]
MSATQPLIRLSGVSKGYLGFQLQDINLELPPGCILGFVGPNGAGKTTTIRIITNLIRPDGGRVEVLGRTWDRDEVAIKSRLGYVSEDNQLYEEATGYWLGNFLGRYYPTWDDAFFRTLLEKFHVPGNKTVKQLSKGNRTKLAVALALAHRPEVLILDEPTSGVDPVVRHTLVQELLEVIQDETRGVFFSSHIIEDIEKVADRVTYIAGGRIALAGDKETILEQWQELTFRLKDAGQLRQVQRLVPYVKESGLEVAAVTDAYNPRLLQELRLLAADEVTRRPLGLEEIMLILTGNEWQKAEEA